MPAELTPKQALIQAKALIADPEYWTQEGFYAADNTGMEVSVQSPHAYCFCALGALFRVNGLDNALDFGKDVKDVPGYIALGAAATLRDSLIAPFNDENDHEDVLAMFDDAIRIAKD